MAAELLSLLPSMFKGGLGIFQSILGGMNKPQRPVYEVPESVRQGTNIAETLASGSMPGKASIQGEIDKNAGMAINSLQESMGSSPNLTSAVANILAKNNEAKTALGVQDANFKVGAQENLIGQKNLEGQYEDKAFGYNQDAKYKESANANSALSGAGLSNLFSGLSDVAGVASYNSLYESFFPKEKKVKGSTGTVPDNLKFSPFMFNNI
jgi:hypothetical protein